MPQSLLQPAPFRTPFFATDGQIHEEWRRFFLSNQTLVNLLLQQIIAGTPHPSLVSADEGDPSDPFIVPGPTGPAGGTGPPGSPGLDGDVFSDEIWPPGKPTGVLWDYVLGRLGIGLGTPSELLDVNGAHVTRASATSTIASTALFDISGSTGRILVRGPDASTNGQFQVITTRSDGSNVLVAVSISVAAVVALIALLDISASGAGQIKFPATQNPSADVNTLDDYAEANWTPTDGSGAGLSLTVASARSTKIGRAVALTFDLTYPTTASGANALITGLPFTAGSAAGGLSVGFSNLAQAVSMYVRAATTQIEIYNVNGGRILNSDLSGKTISGAGMYTV